MGKYGTKLRYSCGPGRMFRELHISQFPRYYQYQNVTCAWNKEWVPNYVKDECVWVACLNPPQPHTSFNLKPLWDGKPIAFGSKVKYECTPEISTNQLDGSIQMKPRYFRSNQTLSFMEVTCAPDGSFAVPQPWPTCVSERRCYSMPETPKGGTREVVGNGASGTELKLTCGPLAKFVAQNDSKELYDEMTHTCGWDGRFHPQRVDSCIATHCLGAPMPPKSTLLELKDDREEIRELFKAYELSYKSQGNTTFHNVVEHPIPSDFCSTIRPQRFVLHGTIPASPRNQSVLATFEIVRMGIPGVAIALEIFPNERRIEQWANPMKGDPKFQVRYPVDDQSQIDVNDFFLISLTCDSLGFQMTVHGDWEFLPFPHVLRLSQSTFTNVVVEGSIDIQHMGFYSQERDFRLPRGFQAAFTCPSDHVFEDDWWHVPKTVITCGEDGTFGHVEWKNCVSVDSILSGLKIQPGQGKAFRVIMISAKHQPSWKT
ncbi:uncharacterized protein LOC131881370 [Tigriopus californicus]|uniref:uncharacterized protein LOC131881370 n=1 Tax=Tigriopus californicus TaxID=6832 RepID=UPI0027D9F615|nr:uncharacterized protein LOC131881370 [Tigriopus californicus]